MDNEVSYQLFEEENILVRNIHVLGSVDNIIRTWSDDIEEGIVHRDLLGVVTFLDLPDDKTTLDDFNRLVKYYTLNKELFAHIKMAQVIQSPVIVFPQIFEKNPAFKSQGFSTIEAAIEWMLFS